MKKIVNIIFIIIAVILQVTIIPKIVIFGSIVNLPLIIMINLILINRLDLADWWVICGILLDLISPLSTSN